MDSEAHNNLFQAHRERKYLNNFREVRELEKVTLPNYIFH